MAAVVFGLFAFFIFVSMRVATPDMQLLYSNLSSTDVGAISAKLEESKIPYKVDKSGESVMVAETDVSKARLLLAESGIPNGGSMGYEIFDEQSGFGQTSFVQNINQVRALEGEMARTIISIESIRSARVHIVLPQRELFSRESREASASVVVKANPGSKINSEQISAIQSLVASAVPELSSKNISVVDSYGNLLARGGGDESELNANKAEEQRIARELHIRQQIEELLGRTVGYGKVRANVTAKINYDRVSLNEEIYDPEGQVLRSAQSSSENNRETEAGSRDVGVENNLPGLNAGGGDSQGSAESQRSEETTNFEISKTIRSTVREVGEIERLSVAVLVDGRYVPGEGEAEGTKVYEPRTQEELEQITRLVKSAIAFDEDRGDTIEVINMQFVEIEMEDGTKDEIMGFNKDDLLDTAQVIAVAIMIILVVLLLLQPMVNRMLEATEEEAAGDYTANDMAAAGLLQGGATQAIAGPGVATTTIIGEDGTPMLVPADENGVAIEGAAPIGSGGADELIDMRSVEGKVKRSTVKKVEDIVDNYPTEAVAVIRGWMSNES